MPTGCVVRCARQAPRPSSPVAVTKRTNRYDQQRYGGRHIIENAFCRLRDFRRVAE